MRSANLRTALILIGAIVATIVIVGTQREGFVAPSNLIAIIQQTAVISIIAFGMTIVIINRGIDLSVGSNLSLAGVLGAQASNTAGGSIAVLVMVVVLSACVVGLINGFLVAFLRINPFMVTLGMYALAGGAAISFSGGQGTPVEATVLRWLGQGSVAGIPVPALVTVVALVVMHLLMTRTLLGRWFFSQGGHRETARASGVPVRITEMSAYAVLGLAVGLGSVINIGRLSSAQPLAGIGMEFSAITAAIIGGTSLKGGRGNILNTFLGSLFVGTIATGLSFMQANQAVTYLSTGLLVVLAVLVAQPESLRALRDRIVRSVRSATSSRAVPAATVDQDSEAAERRRLTIDNVSKRFSGVKALEDISFSVSDGEAVALMGENGAGKSTLVKILAGNHQPSSGRLLLDDHPIVFSSPDASQKAGITVIHQHFTLVPDLTVAENLFLGSEPRFGRFGPINRGEMRKRAVALLDELGIPADPTALVATLSVGHKQMVEIAKAVQADAWLVIMDEPTSALSGRERDRLYELIERLKERGTGIIYISHKMDEVFHVCERAIVLRDGKLVGDPDLSEADSASLVQMMVGRDIENVFPHVEPDPKGTLLTAEHVSDGGVLKNASLEVRSGEIVGLVGLMGAGRTEFIRCVMGLSPVVSGSLSVLGSDDTRTSVYRRSEQGVAFVPEDRHAEGLVPEMSVGDNLTLMWSRRHSKLGLVPVGRERKAAKASVHEMNVRPPDTWREVRFLSGGNQQKVVLGRWLALNPKLVLLDDPTRGVDIGAKAEIHTLMNKLKEEGAGILLTSSELPEVLGVADRVILMRDGETITEYARGVTEEQVMQDAFGTSTSETRGIETTETLPAPVADGSTKGRGATTPEAVGGTREEAGKDD